jgi:hypothetical protein
VPAHYEPPSPHATIVAEPKAVRQRAAVRNAQAGSSRQKREEGGRGRRPRVQHRHARRRDAPRKGGPVRAARLGRPRAPSGLPPRTAPPPPSTHATAHRARPLRAFRRTSPALQPRPPCSLLLILHLRVLERSSSRGHCLCSWASSRRRRYGALFLVVPRGSVAVVSGRDGIHGERIARHWRRVQVPSSFLLISFSSCP